jgi:hypothetical protein
MGSARYLLALSDCQGWYSFPFPSLGASSHLYSWLPAPANLESLVLLSSPASGVLTCGCRHPLTWQGWSSLPSPQPCGFLTFVLVATGTRSPGKVGPPFPLPSLGSSPVYSGQPRLCSSGCWHPLTWQSLSSLPSPQPQDPSIIKQK